MKTIIKATTALALGLTISACASMTSFNNYATSSDIVADAVRSNDIYAETTSAIILKNILRAKDRWPRSFTTLSGISTEPRSGSGVSPALSPRGGAGDQLPFSLNPGSLTGASSSTKNYTVNPLANEKRPEGLLTLIDETTFERYFNNWRRDLAILLFVKELTPRYAGPKCTGDHCPPAVITNSGDNFCRLDDGLGQWLKKHPTYHDTRSGRRELLTCDLRQSFLAYHPNDPALQTPRVDLGKFRFMESKRNFSDSSTTQDCAVQTMTVLEMMGTGHNKATSVENLEKLATLSSAKIALGSDDHPGRLKVEVCKPRTTTKVLVHEDYPDIEFDVALRSFEDMIYYLGETLREEGTFPQVESCKARTSGPLLKVYETDYYGPYAVKVNHAGRDYYAMPAEENPCDRTSTVMSLLTELLILNQSVEFLKAPEIINR